MKKAIVIIVLCFAAIYILESEDVIVYENLKDAVVSGWNGITENDNPVFVGENEVETTLSTPTTLAVIKASLTASDLTDGDLTSSIVVTSDMYTGNESTIGEYDIVFSVSDIEGNITTFTVSVIVAEDPVA